MRRGTAEPGDETSDSVVIGSELISGGSEIQLQHDSAESSVEGNSLLQISAIC